LKVGLNTYVDSIVMDVNNKKNVSGNGINMAQRIMDLGSHSQILMHKRVYDDLSNYEKYKDKFRELGEYTVKHDVKLPVYQYIDDTSAFLNNESPDRKEKKEESARITLKEIQENRITENLLSITLKGSEKDDLKYIYEYIEDFLYEKGAFQNIKVAVAWIADEMIDNVFRWGNISDRDDISFSLDYTKKGILLTTEQPDCPDFNLQDVFDNQEIEIHDWKSISRKHERDEIEEYERGRRPEMPDDVARYLDSLGML